MTNSIAALGQRCAEIAFEAHAEQRRSATLQTALAALILAPQQASRRGLVSIAAEAVLGTGITTRLRRLKNGGGHAPSVAVTPLDETRRRPLDVAAHVRLGEYYLAQAAWTAAYACYRTAHTLARRQDTPVAAIEAALRQPSLNSFFLAEGDPYGRLRFLAHEAYVELGRPPGLVLDIGGGDGFLARLLPESGYALVEPYVNGLDGLALPFETGSFELVVCSHTLEHVEAQQREQLLQELLRVSQRLILLLGPFAPSSGRAQSETAIVAATGAVWAKEHLQYGLPWLQDLCQWLEARQVNYRVTPHADARVMYWQFLATHFARLAGETEAIQTATDFFQNHADYCPADPTEPHDYLVRIIKP